MNLEFPNDRDVLPDDLRRAHEARSIAGESLQRLLSLASQLVRAPMAFISEFQGPEEILRAQLGWREVPEQLLGAEPPLPVGGYLAARREPLILSDLTHHELKGTLYGPGSRQLGALVAFPLLTPSGDSIGVMCLVDSKPRTWLPGELGLLSELAGLAVAGLRQERVAWGRPPESPANVLHGAGTLESQTVRLQRMASIGTLVCGVAHEFNNFLGTIVGKSRLLEAECNCGPQVARHIPDILGVCQRGGELVQRLLRFGRGADGDRRPIRLEPLLEECVGLLTPTLPRSVTLNLTCHPETPVVAADPTQVTQVMINLVTNAWHALRHRAGRIDIELKPIEQVSLRSAGTTLRPGRYACLIVSDNGSGMDAATLGKAFDPFFTTKGPAEGTGLGLSIVRGIVQRHGGEISVRSELGLGTIVTLHFPAAGELVGSGPDSPSRVPPGAGEHLWLLDDDAPMAELLGITLRRWGYRVSWFSEPLVALRAFEEAPEEFALAVTDGNLQGTSGLEVCERLRRLSRSIPIILYTGCITESLRKEADGIGVSEVLEKTTNQADLQAVVQRHLERVGGRGKSV